MAASHLVSAEPSTPVSPPPAPPPPPAPGPAACGSLAAARNPLRQHPLKPLPQAAKTPPHPTPTPPHPTPTPPHPTPPHPTPPHPHPTPPKQMSDAARLMLRHDINLLPVTEAGRVVGIVTRHDVLRGLYSSHSPFLA
jgi:hypothetical protein